MSVLRIMRYYIQKSFSHFKHILRMFSLHFNFKKNLRVSGLIERVIVGGDYLLYLDSNIFSFEKVITIMNKILILNQIVFKKICNLTYENLINT